MSATNRGKKKAADETEENKDRDNYETPRWTVRRLFEELYLPNGRWLEPCAGSGRIIEAIDEDRQGAIEMYAVEKRAECKPYLEVQRNCHIYCPEDFLTWNIRDVFKKGTNPYFDVSFTNPPFSIAFEILSKMLTLSQHVVILQRLNWLGSGVRNEKNEFLRNCMPDVYVIPNRVQFLLNGEFPKHEEGKHAGHKKSGDSIEYAFFHWGPVDVRFRPKGEIRNLRATELEERKLG
jgi:16S rRNA G966 N2-methylase RsmD